MTASRLKDPKTGQTDPAKLARCVRLVMPRYVCVCVWACVCVRCVVRVLHEDLQHVDVHV